MGNQYFSIGSPFAEFVTWTYAIVSILLVFSPFIYLGYRKWKKGLPISWWMVVRMYFYSIIIYFTWNVGAWAAIDELLQRYYTNSWWLTNALLEGGGGPFFAVLIGWPLSTIYIIMGIKPGKYIILNILLSIIISGLLLWAAWHFLILFFAYGFGYIANNL